MTTQKHTRSLTQLGIILNETKHRIARLMEEEANATDPDERTRLRKEIEENRAKESATLAEMRELQAERKAMQIKESGKTHAPGNFMCPECDQTGVDGKPLFADGRHFPYLHTGGNPPCTGLVHAEIFKSGGGWEILYKCDTCGAFE
jgi:hypothetical protein